LKSGHRGELLGRHLLANNGFPALPLRVAAPVIDVLPLVDVVDEQADTMANPIIPMKKKPLLDVADTGRVTPVQHATNTLP
jgi:hypothetical protein